MKMFDKKSTPSIMDNVQHIVTNCYFSKMDPENLNKYLLRVAPFDKPTRLAIKDGKLYGNGIYLGDLDLASADYYKKYPDKVSKIQLLSPMVKITINC